MYNQIPTSNLRFKTTPVTSPSPLPTDRPLPSSCRLGFNKNSLSFLMTSLEPTSSMLKAIAPEHFLPPRSKTQSPLMSLASRLSFSSIQQALYLSFPTQLVITTSMPMPLGAPSSPLLALLPRPTSEATRPPTTNETIIPMSQLTPKRLIQTRAGPHQVTPWPLGL